MKIDCCVVLVGERLLLGLLKSAAQRDETEERDTTEISLFEMTRY
jgi:hypothetical protein